MQKDQTDQMSAKSISSQIICRTMETQYGLRLIDNPAPLSGGVESGAWKVITDKGTFVAKAYSPREGKPERVEEEVQLYDYLLKHGIHVPEVLPTIHGKKVGMIDIRNFSLTLVLMKFEKLRMCIPSIITKEEITKIATTIAYMHQILQEYPHKNKLLTDYRQWEEDREPTYSSLVASPNANIFTSEELQHIQNIDAQTVRYLNSTYVDQTKLNYSVIHRDLALKHTPLLPNGDVYIFDFADRVWGPIAYELAVMFVHLFRADDISFTRWEKLKNWVLEAYQVVKSLTLEEHKALKPFTMSRIMGELYYLNSIAQNIKEEVNARGNRRRYQLLEYLLDKS